MLPNISGSMAHCGPSIVLTPKPMATAITTMTSQAWPNEIRYQPGKAKQVLVDSGIGTLLARWAEGAHFPVIVLAWILAVLIRLATGSATVATITASSLIIGLVEGMGTSQVSLVVLAVGAGSLFFSHVNDAGFWLVKEYFGLTVGQTIKSWSLMETLLSVSGLGVVMLLDLVI